MTVQDASTIYVAPKTGKRGCKICGALLSKLYRDSKKVVA